MDCDRLADYFLVLGVPDSPDRALKPVQRMNRLHSNRVESIYDLKIATSPDAVQGYDPVCSLDGNAKDLNKGMMKTSAFVLQSRQPFSSRGVPVNPITGIGILFTDKNETCPAGWEQLPQNLNKGNFGRHIVMCIQREEEQNPIITITIINKTKGEECPPGFVLIDKDCNAGGTGDHLCICYRRGRRDNSDVIAFQPELLDRFPIYDHTDYALDAQGVAMLCFPQGMSFIKLPRLPTFLSFVITRESGDRIYGAALTFYETLIPTPEERKRGDIPYGALAPKCICLLSHWPFYQGFKEFLSQLYRISVSSSPLPLERYIGNLMNDVPVPLIGHAPVLYRIGHASITFSQPPPMGFGLSDFSLSVLFDMLSIDNIVTIFEYCLCEAKIIIHSNDYAVLTILAESIRSLLFPLDWQHVFIPILPSNLAFIARAPLPFFVGLHRSFFDEILVADDVLLVDVDCDKIRIPTPSQETGALLTLPAPIRQDLMEELEEFRYLYRPRDILTNDSGVFAAPLEFEDSIDEDKIRTSFLRVLVRFLRGHRAYMRPQTLHTDDFLDLSKLFDFNGFENSFLESSRPFVRQLMQTQMFSEFILMRVTLAEPHRAQELMFFEWCSALARACQRDATDCSTNSEKKLFKSMRKMWNKVRQGKRKSQLLEDCYGLLDGSVMTSIQNRSPRIFPLGDFDYDGHPVPVNRVPIKAPPPTDEGLLDKGPFSYETFPSLNFERFRSKLLAHAHLSHPQSTPNTKRIRETKDHCDSMDIKSTSPIPDMSSIKEARASLAPFTKSPRSPDSPTSSNSITDIPESIETIRPVQESINYRAILAIAELLYQPLSTLVQQLQNEPYLHPGVKSSMFCMARIYELWFKAFSLHGKRLVTRHRNMRIARRLRRRKEEKKNGEEEEEEKKEKKKENTCCDEKEDDAGPALLAEDFHDIYHDDEEDLKDKNEIRLRQNETEARRRLLRIMLQELYPMVQNGILPTLSMMQSMCEYCAIASLTDEFQIVYLMFSQAIPNPPASFFSQISCLHNHPERLKRPAPTPKFIRSRRGSRKELSQNQTPNRSPSPSPLSSRRNSNSGMLKRGSSLQSITSAAVRTIAGGGPVSAPTTPVAAKSSSSSSSSDLFHVPESPSGYSTMQTPVKKSQSAYSIPSSHETPFILPALPDYPHPESICTKAVCSICFYELSGEEIYAGWTSSAGATPGVGEPESTVCPTCEMRVDAYLVIELPKGSKPKMDTFYKTILSTNSSSSASLSSIADRTSSHRSSMNYTPSNEISKLMSIQGNTVTVLFVNPSTIMDTAKRIQTAYKSRFVGLNKDLLWVINSMPFLFWNCFWQFASRGIGLFVPKYHDHVYQVFSPELRAQLRLQDRHPGSGSTTDPSSPGASSAVATGTLENEDEGALMSDEDRMDITGVGQLPFEFLFRFKKVEAQASAPAPAGTKTDGCDDEEFGVLSSEERDSTEDGSKDPDTEDTELFGEDSPSVLKGKRESCSVSCSDKKCYYVTSCQPFCPWRLFRRFDSDETDQKEAKITPIPAHRSVRMIMLMDQENGVWEAMKIFLTARAERDMLHRKSIAIYQHASPKKNNTESNSDSDSDADPDQDKSQSSGDFDEVLSSTLSPASLLSSLFKDQADVFYSQSMYQGLGQVLFSQTIQEDFMSLPFFASQYRKALHTLDVDIQRERQNIVSIEQNLELLHKQSSPSQDDTSPNPNIVNKDPDQSADDMVEALVLERKMCQSTLDELVAMRRQVGMSDMAPSKGFVELAAVALKVFSADRTGNFLNTLSFNTKANNPCSQDDNNSATSNSGEKTRERKKSRLSLHKARQPVLVAIPSLKQVLSGTSSSNTIFSLESFLQFCRKFVLMGSMSPASKDQLEDTHGQDDQAMHQDTDQDKDEDNDNDDDDKDDKDEDNYDQNPQSPKSFSRSQVHNNGKGTASPSRQVYATYSDVLSQSSVPIAIRYYNLWRALTRFRREFGRRHHRSSSLLVGRDGPIKDRMHEKARAIYDMWLSTVEPLDQLLQAARAGSNSFVAASSGSLALSQRPIIGFDLPGRTISYSPEDRKRGFSQHRHSASFSPSSTSPVYLSKSLPISSPMSSLLSKDSPSTNSESSFGVLSPCSQASTTSTPSASPPSSSSAIVIEDSNINVDISQGDSTKKDLVPLSSSPYDSLGLSITSPNHLIMGDSLSFVASPTTNAPILSDAFNSESSKIGDDSKRQSTTQNNDGRDEKSNKSSFYKWEGAGMVATHSGVLLPRSAVIAVALGLETTVKVDLVDPILNETINTESHKTVPASIFDEIHNLVLLWLKDNVYHAWIERLTSEIRVGCDGEEEGDDEEDDDDDDETTTVTEYYL